jgi:diadenosine tetraphosphate (Ap4A) HIT family hydrolase
MSATKSCPFCKILKNDKRKQIIKRGPNLTAIRKNYDSNTVNFMLVSNDHLDSFSDLDLTTKEGVALWREIMVAAKNLANGRDFGLKITNGKEAGQTVQHAHVHVFSHEQTWDNVK